MTTLHKTFVNNEYVDADQYNNALNPTTADHIPYAVAAGSVDVTFAASNVATANITFPAGRFTVPPIVTCNPTGGFATVARATAITANGCTLIDWTPAGNNITETHAVHWEARQMTPTTAAG